MIYKEGIIIGAAVFLFALVIQTYAGYLVALPVWFILILVLYLFRDPEREIPSMPLAVVSPVDGKITEVSEIHDPFVNRQAIRIKIKMNSLGVYTTRSPIEGKIVKSWIKNFPDKHNTNVAAKDAKDFGLWIQSDENDDVILVLQPQPLLKSIKCFVQSGERIGQGRRCGFIRFGSSLELYIPGNSKISVGAGDSVHAGSSILATLVHKTPVSAV